METKKKLDTVDVDKILKTIWANKRLFFIVMSIVFVLSCIYIFSQPRTYSTSLKLAPEMENNSLGGGLSSLVASFGIDLNSMKSSDAITPLLYPDLMEDNQFVSSLFDVKVTTQDKELSTTYYDYIDKHQNVAWTYKIFGWVKDLFPESDSEGTATGGGQKKNDPYFMSKRQDMIAGIIRNKISIAIDKRTAVITVNTTDQDPLICKTIADSVKMKLQNFITNYRTSKARRDVEYYTEITAEAKQSYEKARQLYGSYADANVDMVLESFKAKQNDLENDMQLKFNAYTAFNTQLQNAKSKVVERTPAFTLLKGASVPIKPSGPKRMIFVFVMMMLSFLGTCSYIFIRNNIKNRKVNKTT